MLDLILAKLQVMQPFAVETIVDGKVVDWYHVDATVLNDVVIREQDLATQVQLVGAQIAHWGRLVALCERMLAIHERAYRTWKARQVLELRTGNDGKKKLTGEEIESTYRMRPEYAVFQEKLEKAQEAVSGVKAILDGFKAKKDMLRVIVFRTHDGNVQMSV